MKSKNETVTASNKGQSCAQTATEEPINIDIETMRKIVYVNRLEASNLDEGDIDNMLRLFEDGFDQFETNLFALQQCANVYQAIEYLSKQDQ